MKLNLDCMRAIMLEIEKQPFNSELRLYELQEQLNNYSHDELEYTCLKLKEAGFINARTISDEYVTKVIYIIDLTYIGHQFLAEVRSDNIWNKTKAVFSKIGASSVTSAAQIASAILTEIIRKELNL